MTIGAASTTPRSIMSMKRGMSRDMTQRPFWQLRTSRPRSASSNWLKLTVASMLCRPVSTTTPARRASSSASSVDVAGPAASSA